MSTAVDFHSQIASIMEVLANAAVAEICKVVDDGYAVVHLEMSRSQKENEFLRRKIKLLELQIARYRAERVKGMEGSISSRFPGVRLLNRHSKDSLAGQLLQGKTRFQNRDPRVQQSVQKRRSGVDCDPDQDVVTTTKTESAEPEDERELLIVKVEGALEPGSSNNKTLVGACISTRGGTDTATSLPATSKNDSNSQPARCHNKTEVSGSDTVTFVVGRTAKTDSSSTTHSSQLTGSSVRAEDSQPLNSVINIMPHRDEVPTCFDDSVDGIKDDEAALNTSKSFLSEVIVIDGGGASDKEGEACEWSHVDKANRETGRGIDRHEQTSLPIIQYLGLESVENRLMQEGSVLPCDDPPGTSGGGIASSVNSSSDAPSLAVHYLVPPPNKSGYKPSSSSCHLAFYHAVTTERPYGCTSCTKRFFLQSDLQKHMARHTREKPYTCLLCSKSFVCQSQLDIHRNVHTGDRPFSCSICNRCFSHPSNLKRHQKIQH